MLRVVRETASALDYAQSENVVHHDIKPSNILLGPKGVAKVADFGIAKLHDQSVELTRTGSVVGSPQHMSPEQIRGEDLDGRSDIFSLGVVFYELLSRTRPFGGDTISTLVFEILAKEPPPIESLRPGLPPTLVQLVRSMMVKDRNLRIADAGKVVESIQQLEREIPAAELDRPASQASGADGLPTQLMPSGQQSAGHSQTVPTPSPMSAHGNAQAAGYGQPLPFATGPQTLLPFASSNPSGNLAGVPMGAPLPSGPLTAVPRGRRAARRCAGLRRPAGAAGRSGLERAAAPARDDPAGDGVAAGDGAALRGATLFRPAAARPAADAAGAAVLRPAAAGSARLRPAPARPAGPRPRHAAAVRRAGPGYGQQRPPAYPTAKPTSPLKLILLLGVFAVVGPIGAFVLYVLFSGSDQPATPASQQSSTTTTEPPPAPGASQLTQPTEGTTQYADGRGDFKPTTEAAPGPTWTEPQPTTGGEETADPAPAAPVPTPPPRRPPRPAGPPPATRTAARSPAWATRSTATAKPPRPAATSRPPKTATAAKPATTSPARRRAPGPRRRRPTARGTTPRPAPARRWKPVSPSSSRSARPMPRCSSGPRTTGGRSSRARPASSTPRRTKKPRPSSCPATASTCWSSAMATTPTT